MAVLRCSLCGGDLEVNSDYSVGVCKYCDSMITIPKDIDKKGNLYNRAVFLRQNNEFDKAVEAYEDILKEDNSDAEAHWGLVLSKFGIEYVLDPNTQKRIPTCHRTQLQSILSDPDYLAAIEHSDISAQNVIKNEANRINKIQAEILGVSNKEEPYDIFICYKENDKMGNRTEDSILAQELYYELKKKGYRIFFARKSLENRLGDEYEPIIFAALNSAKVMIVLGTKVEYFNEVWVKNEWGRFLHMSHENNKTIIPAYRDMSPYELPAELSVLQSLDMSKIGFMQDLTDGIERCMRKETVKKVEQREVVQYYGSVPLERLLQNGDTYIKLGNYEAAKGVYNTVTKEYPEDYRGWWGCIVCETESFTQIVGSKPSQASQEQLNRLFGYVRQLATPADYQKVESQYIEYNKLLSEQAADIDIKNVSDVVKECDRKLNEVKNQIQSLKTQIEKRENDIEWAKKSYPEKIKNQEKNLSRETKKYKRRIVGFTASLIILIIGIVWWSAINWLQGLIIIITSLFFMFGGKSETCKEISRNKELLRVSIDKTRHEKSTYESKCYHEIGYLKVELEKQENELALIQEKKDNCGKYLGLGKDKIAEFWFSKFCDNFGVEKDCDGLAQIYRDNAVGSVEGAIDDIMSVCCSACGEKRYVGIKEFISKGYTVCQKCGNKIYSPIINEV